MTKKLNTDAIKNELAESVFFRKPSQTGSTPAPSSSVSAAPAGGEPLPVRPVLPVRGGPPHQRPGKRLMKQRHPFDIYRDQYDSLQELSLADRKQGGMGSMSAMVRQALDEFIIKKRRELSE
jgi:hypothetical protein